MSEELVFRLGYNKIEIKNMETNTELTIDTTGNYMTIGEWNKDVKKLLSYARKFVIKKRGEKDNG